MFGFIKYIWKEYKKSLKLKVLNDKLNNMMSDSKILHAKDMQTKYGNPSAMFARTQWEIYQIKKGLK